MSQEKAGNVSMENIYRLDGRVPVGKAIPFGLQHVLAMFVSNLTPITARTLPAGDCVPDSERDVRRRNRFHDSALSYMEGWRKTAHHYGCEFHLCNHFINHCRKLWLPDRNRRRIGRRHL